ncbi:hypothetical protein [Burkholderia arboris]|uniref:hypothetical protein n=1 Tax=Burkholderia arboris TaxID=488730 RepID=UPI00210C9D20|nr:hypothetical protein [Burkholderia arboris]UTV59794.1 hypothetical protein NLX30_37005 [Burkholderia arboris]
MPRAAGFRRRRQRCDAGVRARSCRTVDATSGRPDDAASSCDDPVFNGRRIARAGDRIKRRMRRSGPRRRAPHWIRWPVLRRFVPDIRDRRGSGTMFGSCRRVSRARAASTLRQESSDGVEQKVDETAEAEAGAAIRFAKETSVMPPM